MNNKKFWFIDVPSWSIILMPILLVSGPLLSDFALSLVSILFLINSYKNNLKKYYNNIYFKLFLVFCIVLIISSLQSNNILLSLKNSFFYFRFGIFSLCFWYLLDKNSRLLKYLFYSVIICFLALIVDGYIQYLLGENLLGTKLYNKYRVSSFFGDELILGSYLARFFPILFGLFVFFDEMKKNKKLLLLITLIFILSEGLIFLSGERLALFYMNLSAVFIIIMINNYKFYRLITYIGSIFLITILLIIFPQSKERFIDKTIYDFTRNSDNKIYIFSKPHNHMYIAGYKMFLDNKLLGVGPRQFRNECKYYPIKETRVSENEIVSPYHCSSHPHNTYVELLSETGIIGFLFVFLLFIIIVIASLKHLYSKFLKKKNFYFNDFEVCLLSSLIISIWPFAPSGSFFNNWMSIVYFFPIGMLLWQLERKKNK
tara:strand:+ start:6906 stop:8192 length:1287 start_codon:yes stop_codon:yes gene_type:complete